MKPTTTHPNTKRAALLDIVRQFRQAHGDRPFTANEVAEWAKARGLYPLPANDERRPA